MIKKTKIIIGPSEENKKDMSISNRFTNGVYLFDKNNWLNDDKSNEKFEVTINEGHCLVNRVDSSNGWDLFLVVDIDFLIPANNIIPIVFINLEKDSERLTHIESVLNNIFNKEDIYRIEGVEHNIGSEGCRLAHINANIFAINNSFDYYIIAEDDIQSLVDKNEISNYITNATKYNPDMVLLEQAQNLEKIIRLEIDERSPHMYKIFSGGNGAGCYMPHKDFGIKLIKHWMKEKNRHADISWQDLWESNNIYFHKPQLFNQREGFSNQDDVGYRETQRPFDWDLYQKYARKKTNNIPVFFINSERDKKKNDHIQKVLNSLFDKNDIYKIDKVDDIDATRISHINAHALAINSNFEYYLIIEDDLTPLVDLAKIKKYIDDSIISKPDLVLFEKYENLKNIIKTFSNDNLYRIFSGINTIGCYLCNKTFGTKLVFHWLNQENRKIEDSWQDLWKDNKVFIHQPQLFERLYDLHDNI